MLYSIELDFTSISGSARFLTKWKTWPNGRGRGTGSLLIAKGFFHIFLQQIIPANLYPFLAFNFTLSGLFIEKDSEIDFNLNRGLAAEAAPPRRIHASRFPARNAFDAAIGNIKYNQRLFFVHRFAYIWCFKATNTVARTLIGVLHATQNDISDYTWPHFTVFHLESGGGGEEAAK